MSITLPGLSHLIFTIALVNRSQLLNWLLFCLLASFLLFAFASCHVEGNTQTFRSGRDRPMGAPEEDDKVGGERDQGVCALYLPRFQAAFLSANVFHCKSFKS